jgi:endonuclease/exonuclease/phosphatase family metal-dependent hydrolase
VTERGVRVLSWNLFHGRDHAPDASLHTWRSRLTGRAERSGSHAQVNRDLLEEFISVLAGAEWDVALLQECPPRWAEALAEACRAEAHLVLTSRNLSRPLAPLQRAVARRNPDLIASWEGGSNLTLARGAFGTPIIRERRELNLTKRPEPRRMAFTVLRDGLCVANLHASVPRDAAAGDVRLAATTAVAWSAGAPLVFGGDLNLRPSTSPEVFEELAVAHSLAPPTAPGAIDHLLARGLAVASPPAAWADRDREVPDTDLPALRIRLSDHAPVEATFTVTN